jgi:RES domain-containing protein
MILWRISRHKDLRGAGGLRAGGRWHSPGQPVVYLSESPAAALLEICVHTAANDIPPEFTLLRIEGSEVEVSSVELSELPKRWQEKAEATREIGTEWLRAGRGVLLRVPSVIVPYTWNFVFNPLHRDAERFRVVERMKCPFDQRIKK